MPELDGHGPSDVRSSDSISGDIGEPFAERKSGEELLRNVLTCDLYGEGVLIGKLLRAGELDSGSSWGDSNGGVNDTGRGDEGESACVGESVTISRTAWTESRFSLRGVTLPLLGILTA